ncbi:hypothetical protein CPB84DRAFT_1862974 [Gymnopilus junonius]|uniref:Uncharacterized protein n=1 Tax=Gymnopilus junonius TaxID=109634 RepID=A0A9P5TW51_GYMJU|nr:hypothetical protein CPB84DRAFT_1862974 [Gymnopilus junonius]
MTGQDWTYYYVNMFLDRDMFMRYLGNGIGHRATNHLHFEKCTSEETGDLDDDAEVDSIDGDELEEIPSDEEDDFGYNHNGLKAQEDMDTDEDEVLGGNADEVQDDDWDSMYVD